MKRSKRVTLRDVAKETGVSAKTVSNVVNNTGNVSAPVRQEILEAIERLGYQPNLAARHLRKGSSRMIALIVPTLREPYFAELASVFVTKAQDFDVTVLITETDGDREREKLAIEGHNLPGIDAVVCSPLSLQESDLDSRLSKIPVVLLGEYAESFAGDAFDFQIGFDNVEAAKVATNHLLNNGARHIAVIGHQTDKSQATSSLRFEGYKTALESAGVAFDEKLVGTVTDFNRRESAQALQRIIDNHVEFDGILCFSDTMALGTIAVLASNDSTRNRTIPIVGFDNIEEAKFAHPPFDTIDPHMEQIAQVVLERLFSADRSDGYPKGDHVKTDFTLISRSIS